MNIHATASYEEQMTKNYLQYAVSVIMDRALPDVRDGLKPVQRRILYTAYEINATPKSQHLKSARIVGETMAKYHPHGDAAIYDAMVRMAQDFTFRYPLIDGHGNVGSIDGDTPAAMRYTEARLSPIAMKMMEDLEYGTVEYNANFDGTLQVPTVLPTSIPNLLINGASGIAVGLSTNIPSHNLREVINALIALIHNPDLSVAELMQYIPAPDFPTGGIIVGTDGVRAAYETGQGRIVIRAKHHIETVSRGKQQIVITEIPYLVSKSSLLEEIASLSEKGKIDGIADIRDESNREGLRIVLEIRKGFDPEITVNQLFKYSKLQDNYHVQMIALVNNRPLTLNLKDCLAEYLKFKEKIVINRTKFKIKKFSDELHVLKGIQIAIDNLDEVISIIRSSRTIDSARSNLIKKLEIDEVQATAILRMSLSRLVSTERSRLKEDIENLIAQIKDLEEILGNEKRRKNEIIQELEEIKTQFGDDRRTTIVEQAEETTFTEEEIIPDIPTTMSISARNYIKRHDDIAVHKPLKNDAPRFIAKGSTRDRVTIFTDKGNAYGFLLHAVTEHHGSSAGDPIRRYLAIPQDEEIVGSALISDASDGLIFFATANGNIKCTPAKEYVTRRGSIAAIKLNENDRVIAVWSQNPKEKKQILAITERGMAIRFSTDQVPRTGRSTQGVILIKLAEGDRVIWAGSVNDSDNVYLFDTNGYGKKTLVNEIDEQNRGGKGKRLLPRTWSLRSACAGDGDELGIFTNESEFIMIQSTQLTATWKIVDDIVKKDISLLWMIPLIKTKDTTPSDAENDSPQLFDTPQNNKPDEPNDSGPDNIDDSGFQLVLLD